MPAQADQTQADNGSHASESHDPTHATETAGADQGRSSDVALHQEHPEEAGHCSEDDAPDGEPSDSEPSDLGSEEDGDSDNDGAIDENDVDGEALLDALPPVQAMSSASQAEVTTSPLALKTCSESWTGCPAPGQLGFNDFATRALRLVGIDKPSVDAGGLLPHQMAVAFLLHPSSPIKRLLVDHPTGSGKTREMISVLDNFFHDPRPKIPIFPKESVCRNFYFELLKWPSKYRDFFSCLQPKAAKAASGVDDWRSRRHQVWDVSHLKETQVRRLCQTMRDTLEMKAAFIQGRLRKSVRDDFLERFPGEAFLVAPLRALRYTSAGGGSIRMRSGAPVQTLFKIGFDPKSRNVYSNKVVVMDEVHNLVRTKTRYLRQLDKLRELLVSAGNVLLAGFTGTPILSEPDEGRKLLDIIKGSLAPDADEGYLASFQMRPLSLYPRCVPTGMPDAVLTKPLVSQLVHRVVLHGEVLKTYDIKLKGGCPGSKLGTYCNLYAHPSSFHGGKSGTRTKILGSPEECAPKLLAIAREIAEHPGKALVLISKSHGYRPMLALMKQVAKSHRPPFEVATMEQLSQFNDPSKNLRGEAFKVMVADAAQCAEGVSFLSVRRVFLAEVPNSPSALIQLCSRALRMYGHRWLPVEEQEVRFFLYVAQMPSWLQTPMAAWALRVQPKSVEGRTMEVRAHHFSEILQQAGVHSLRELKDFLHAYVQTKKSRNKSLDTEDVFGILVQLGLWNEVKRIWEAEYEQLSEATGDRLQPAVGGAGMADSTSQPRSRPGQALVQAMQELFRAKDLMAYQQTLCYETADAAALRRLVRMTASFAPALANLRSKAVDGSVLRTCYGDKLEKECCDDIVLTLDGDAFMIPSGVDRSVSQTLTLPSGWKVDQELQTDKASLVKFFITDPSGKHYETSRAALHAISCENAKQQAHERGQIPGLKIVLNGCEGRPHLNGQQGTLVQWLDTEGQWEVDLKNAGSIHVSPEHVKADPGQHQTINQQAEAEQLTTELEAAEKLVQSELEHKDDIQADAETAGKGVDAVATEMSTETKTEETVASPRPQTSEVVILDEVEEVVDYFRDDGASAKSSLSMETDSKSNTNMPLRQQIHPVDLTHELRDYFRTPNKVERTKASGHSSDNSTSTDRATHGLTDFLRSAKKPSSKTNAPDHPSLPSSTIDLTHELADYFRLAGDARPKVPESSESKPSSASRKTRELADFLRSPPKSETRKPPESSENKPSPASGKTRELAGFLRSAPKSEPRKPPESSENKPSPASGKTQELAGFLRSAPKSEPRKPPESSENKPSPASGKTQELGNFLRSPKSDQTQPPKSPPSQPSTAIDLTHEVADYFRSPGVTGQPASASRPKTQEEHKPESDQPQVAAQCSKKRKAPVSDSGSVKTSSEHGIETQDDRKGQRRVFIDTAAASVAADTPSQGGSLSEPIQQDGHGHRSSQPQSALPCSTKRKLAFSLPGMVKADGPNQRGLIKDAKRQRGVQNEAAELPAPPAVAHKAGDSALSKPSTEDARKQAVAQTPALSKPSLDDRQKQAVAQSPALSKPFVDDTKKQAVVETPSSAEKALTNVAALLDIIDLVDLDEDPVKSQNQMQHSLSDWFRKAPVR